MSTNARWSEALKDETYEWVAFCEGEKTIKLTSRHGGQKLSEGKEGERCDVPSVVRLTLSMPRRSHRILRQLRYWNTTCGTWSLCKSEDGWGFRRGNRYCDNAQCRGQMGAGHNKSAEGDQWAVTDQWDLLLLRCDCWISMKWPEGINVWH